MQKREERKKKDYNYVYKYFIYYCTRKILFEIHLKWSKKSFYDYCDYRWRWFQLTLCRSREGFEDKVGRWLFVLSRPYSTFLPLGEEGGEELALSLLQFKHNLTTLKSVRFRGCRCCSCTSGCRRRRRRQHHHLQTLW